MNNERLTRQIHNAENMIDEIDLESASDMLVDCQSELIVGKADQSIVDQSIAKCQRIQEITHEINDAFADIITIFKNAARDCGIEVDDGSN